MLLPDNDRGRPVTIQTASRMSTLTDSPSVPSQTDDRPRCRKCQHVVWTERSIASGLGTDCRRAERRANRQTAVAA